MSNEFEVDWPTQDQAKTRWSKPETLAAPAPETGKEIELQWPEPPSVSKDVGKSMGAGAILGVGDIPATPGGLSQLVDAATEKLYKYGIMYPMAAGSQLYHKFDPTSKELKFEDIDPFIAKAKEVGKQFQSPAEQKGDVTTILGAPVPTPQGMERVIKEKVPAAQYEPETTAGEYGHTIARTATGFTGMGGKEKAGERFVQGVFGGAGSEAAGQAVTGAGMPELDPYARFLGNIMGAGVGSFMSNGVRNMALPSEAAEKELMGAMVKDYQNGTMSMTPDQIKQALASGERPLVYDMLGPEGRAILEKHGYKIGEFNKALEQRSTEAGTRLANHIENNVANKPLDAPARQAAIEQANKGHIDALYDLNRKDPNSWSVWTPKLEKLANESPTFQAAMKDAQKAAQDINAGSIVANDPYQRVMGIDQLSQGVKPNLNYWDQVKRNLDDKITSAFKSGESNEARRLMGIKNQLVGELDSTVSGYANARNAAAESLGAQTSVEAGYNSMKNLNAFKSQDVMDAFKKMSPAQQEEFRYGMMSYMKEMAADKGPKSFLNSIEKSNTWDRAEAVLGKKALDQIHGNAVAQNLISKIDTLRTAAPDSVNKLLNSPTTAGALGAGMAELGKFGIEHISGMSPGQIATLLVGAAGGLATKGWYTVAENRMAPRLMELAASNDPVKLAELSVALRNNSTARSFIQKTERGIDQLTRNIATTQQASQADTRPERKDGGRVNREAEMIIRDAGRTKKMIDGHTEKLLTMPDDAIITALDTAKRTLGGHV